MDMDKVIEQLVEQRLMPAGLQKHDDVCYCGPAKVPGWSHYVEYGEKGVVLGPATTDWRVLALFPGAQNEFVQVRFACTDDAVEDFQCCVCWLSRTWPPPQLPCGFKRGEEVYYCGRNIDSPPMGHMPNGEVCPMIGACKRGAKGIVTGPAPHGEDGEQLTVQFPFNEYGVSCLTAKLCYSWPPPPLAGGFKLKEHVYNCSKELRWDGGEGKRVGVGREGKVVGYADEDRDTRVEVDFFESNRDNGGRIDVAIADLSRTHPPRPGAAGPSQGSTGRQIDDLYKAVVAVGVSIDGVDPRQQRGTGFFVDRATGLVVTCHHVLLDMNADPAPRGTPANAARVYCLGVGDGDSFEWRYEAEVKAVSVSPMPPKPGQPDHRADQAQPWLDLAVLRVTRQRDGALLRYPLAPQLQLGNSDEDAMATSQPLWVLGYGQQLSHVAQTRNTCQGNYAGRRPDDRTGSCWLMTTADVLAGHSGGPAVDMYGRVVGWCLLSLTDPTGRGGGREAAGGLHAVRPINEARQVLSPWGVEW